ncbi:hypothetical protein [Marinilabilia rubra]|uniref:Uncharacterized protein n=1 Tax=Marinilabilia rubra TaxID=2162893 RepID=A0A2U2BE33_9BACT|nr:hypothetical protein [Marinilabilia rubra]PWE01334.1 hypothetical protein DDZ16_02280 [Marinilabilia rubra]
MEFKKLELETENRGLKGWIKTRHFKTSIISIVVGAAAGFGYYYFSEAKAFDSVIFTEAFKFIAMGGFLGFFVTNSPCARGRC